MFILRASNAQVCALCLRCLELRFSGRDGLIPVEAALQEVA